MFPQTGCLLLLSEDELHPVSVAASLKGYTRSSVSPVRSTSVHALWDSDTPMSSAARTSNPYQQTRRDGSTNTHGQVSQRQLDAILRS